eukprot:420263_1
MMVMYYWLVFLIIFTKSQALCEPECNTLFYQFCCGDECCVLNSAYCSEAETYDYELLYCENGQCVDCPPVQPCDNYYGDNAQKNSEMQDGSVNKTVAHNYYDNWWIIIAIVAVIMVVCCGVALCWLKKVKVKAYGHVGKENEAVEEEMELQETQS